MGKVIYTYYRKYTRHVEEEDSLTAALERAHYDEDSGEASVESITTERGVVIDTETMHRWWNNHKQAQRHGSQKEWARFMALRDETSRLITWQEASTIIR